MNTHPYPTDQEARAQILETGRRMYARQFVASNDGNLSCRVGQDAVWATPTGVSKGFMQEDSLVMLRLDGQVLSQGALPASSEVKMHLAIYRQNPDIGAVVHAHPPLSTAYAIAGKALDAAVYPEALVNLGVVPCVPYARPGSRELPEAVAPYSLSHNAVLLANHGAVTWGRTMEEAWFRMEALEQYALILMYVGMIGGAQPLSQSQVAEVLAIRESLGIKTGGVPTGFAEGQAPS